MAGFSRIYCVGGDGGYEGADGIHPMHLQIWQGEGNRQWLEAHWFEAPPQPLGQIRRVVPVGPDHQDALLDACIAFLPDHFAGCPSLERVRAEVGSAELLDLDGGGSAAWRELREEARQAFHSVPIWEAELRRVPSGG